MKGARGGLLALVLALALAEIAVRFTGPDRFGALHLLPFDMAEPVVSGLRTLDDSNYLIFDRELGWQVGPGRRSRNGLYNSKSFGERVSPARPESAELWATAFGDSFTHGDDVADADTWLARLGDHDLPSRNFAVPGYGVDQAWLRYRHLKTAVATNVVLIGVMADNIGRHLNRYRPFITPAERIFFVKPRFELVGGGLQLVPSPFRGLPDYERPPEALRPALFDIGLKDRFFDRRLYETHPMDALRLFRIARTLRLKPAEHADWTALYRDEDAVALSLAVIQGFVREVRQDGRSPVIVFLPERRVARDVVGGRTPLTAAFVDRLRRLGAPLVDLTGTVGDFAAREGDGSFLPHYSPALSRAVAAYIADWKKTEKSLP